MKIITLIENTACRENLSAEHGLCLYIEALGKRILFDMGQTDAFIGNAEKLGVDLAKVDLAILSHGHYDHGGGMNAFLALNDHAPIYLNRHAFGRYFNGTEKYIGLDSALQRSGRLVFTGEETEILPGLSLHACNEKTPALPINPHGLNKQTDAGFAPDDFLHEHALLIEENSRRVLISGCAHKGVVNYAGWFSPDVLIGGFHLKKVTDETALLAIADALLAHPTTYYTGHCTGDAQYAMLKARMNERLHAISTGSTIEL